MKTWLQWMPFYQNKKPKICALLTYFFHHTKCDNIMCETSRLFSILLEDEGHMCALHGFRELYQEWVLGVS